MIQQQLNITLSIAQWGEVKPDHVEPEQKILSKSVVVDSLFEIAVGGRNDSYISGNPFDTA